MQFEAIKNILPHRFPFLLIDRVISCGDNKIEALKNISANEPFFPGHFPELAVMPGVLQIEAMAQAAGLLLASMKQYKPESNLAFLASVDAAKFKGLVTPGDQLKIQVELRAARAGIYKFDAKAYVDSQLVSLATVVLAVRAR